MNGELVRFRYAEDQKRRGQNRRYDEHEHERAHETSGAAAVSAVYAAGKAEGRAGQHVPKSDANQPAEKQDFRAERKRTPHNAPDEQGKTDSVFDFIHDYLLKMNC